MSTFIEKYSSSNSGPRVAVKDLIDIAGEITTAGCKAVQQSAKIASHDAALLAGLRSQKARIVGKTNLHELAMLPFGTNPWFGTPVNPFDIALIPGGSSSGSAVAVANDEADVALGSDTGGSIRVPSACCGTAGLKTTFGRIPLDGVYPMNPSFDTVGPMATSIGGLVLGMSLLEPGFEIGGPVRRIGRVRVPGDPDIDAAIDAALGAAEFEVVDIEIPEIEAAAAMWSAVYFDEIWDVDGDLYTKFPEMIGDDIKSIMDLGGLLRSGAADARAAIPEWRRKFFSLFDQVELLALPTIPVRPPTIAEVEADMASHAISITQNTAIFNLAGAPCSAQPVPMSGARVPASLQLVGPLGSEEVILATAAVVEKATAR